MIASFNRVLLKLLLRFRRLEKYAVSIFLRSEGGEICLESSRALYRKVYRINAGLFTYGCFTKGFNLRGGKITVGRYCSIAAGVKFLEANHPINHFSSLTVFYNKTFGYDVKDVKRHDLNIEDDVWIGNNTNITCSCKKIGRGSVIGAGSIVTKDVEPYTIVADNPARVIRKRFDDKRIEQLQASRWWEKSPQQLIIDFKEEIYE